MNKQNFLVLLVIGFLLIILFSRCSNNYIKEKEPNNTLYQAEFINIGEKVKAKLSNRDIDYFKIYSEKKELFNIILTSKNIENISIDIIKNNKIIKAISFFSNQNKEIIIKNCYISNESINLRIKEKNSQKNIEYKLNIVKSKLNIGNSEKESNDDLVTANIISITNGYIVGNYSSFLNMLNFKNNYKDEDWFSFYINSSNIILSLEVTGVPGIDSVMELYNKYGVLLKKIDSNGVDEPEVLKNYSIKIPDIYYVRLYNKKGSNNKIPYQFYINSTPVRKHFEIEPNDNFNNANIISNFIKGYINPDKDTDFYKFNTDKPVILNISLTPLNNIDSVIKIYNSNWQLIKIINSKGLNEAEMYPDLFFNKGEYFISISDLSNNQNYQDSYTLTLKQIHNIDKWEKEDNNEFNRSTSIYLNSTLSGFLAPEGDIDIYRLSLQQDTKIKLLLSPIPMLDTIITLYNDKYTTITNINKGGIGEGENEDISLKGGKIYYFIIHNVDNKKCNYSIDYKFSIFKR